MQDIITVSTSKKQEMIDITNQVASIVKKSGLKSGLCHIYSMHSTAAIVVNENADPDISLDTIDALNKLVAKGIWRHDKLEGNADAHIKATILGPSRTIPAKDGKLQLGTWQGISVFELDGPRKREIAVTVLGD